MNSTRKKVFLSEEEKQEHVSVLAERYGVSRHTIYRALKGDGSFWQRYHTKEVCVDLKWVNENLERIEEEGWHGALVAIGRIMNHAGKYGWEVCLPMAVEDVFSEARLRVIELSGHERRDEEEWCKKVAFSAASTYLQKQWGEIRRVNKVREKFRAESEFLLTSEEANQAKAALSLFPEEILAIAEKLVVGEKLTKKEKATLEDFRASYGWLRTG